MSALPQLLGIQCMTCSRFRHPGEIVTMGESIKICWDCFEKQKRVIEHLGETPPEECPMCHRKFAELAAESKLDHVPMYAHWADGTFALVCAVCDKDYVLKRRDMYGKTRFGYDRKVV